MISAPVVAVDVGNSRVKFGLFLGLAEDGRLPEPAESWEVEPQQDSFDEVVPAHLAERSVRECAWWIGSVQRSVASRLVDWLRDREAHQITMMAVSDLPLTVSLPRPDMVGIDRLLNAVAANRLRTADRPAVVVDLGTAITVDLVSRQGAFLGGAILPGIATSARALYEFTDLLPLIDMRSLADPPTALGTATLEALRSGLFWGAVGGVKELIAQFGKNADGESEVFLTGGAAPSVAGLLATSARFEPHLTLAGIALTAVNSR